MKMLDSLKGIFLFSCLILAVPANSSLLFLDRHDLVTKNLTPFDVPTGGPGFTAINIDIGPPDILVIGSDHGPHYYFDTKLLELTFYSSGGAEFGKPLALKNLGELTEKASRDFGQFNSQIDMWLRDTQGPFAHVTITRVFAHVRDYYSCGVGPKGGRFEQLSSFGCPTSVPEPDNWLLMIGGFGLVGSALRLRHWHPVHT